MEIEVIVIERWSPILGAMEFYSVMSVKSFETWVLANEYELSNEMIICDRKWTGFQFSSQFIFV